MPAKWFCNDCGKEIWQGLDQNQKETETVAEMERVCMCTDCRISKDRVIDALTEDIPEGYRTISVKTTSDCITVYIEPKRA